LAFDAHLAGVCAEDVIEGRHGAARHKPLKAAFDLERVVVFADPLEALCYAHDLGAGDYA